MSKILLIFLLLVTIGPQCNEIDCGNLPAEFSSYDEALKTISNTQFKIEESINTEKSSWILNASYLSCDGHTGFFIIKTKTKEYIHSDVPITIWHSFKKSESFGSYYNQNIKGFFTFKLNL